MYGMEESMLGSSELDGGSYLTVAAFAQLVTLQAIHCGMNCMSMVVCCLHLSDAIAAVLHPLLTVRV